jgi:hypothetical protein
MKLNKIIIQTILVKYEFKKFYKQIFKNLKVET